MLVKFFKFHTSFELKKFLTHWASLGGQQQNRDVRAEIMFCFALNMAALIIDSPPREPRQRASPRPPSRRTYVRPGERAARHTSVLHFPLLLSRRTAHRRKLRLGSGPRVGTPRLPSPGHFKFGIVSLAFIGSLPTYPHLCICSLL